MTTEEIRKSNILLVDDSPANLRLLSKILSEEGYTVRAAPSGASALSTIRKEAPDLVLLDIIMPDMDGYEVCRALKNDEETRDIPIIFLSAKDEVEDKVKAFQAGGIDYIPKPYQMEEVLVRVKTHLDLIRIRKREREELVLAGQVQRSILPTDFSDIDSFNIILHYLPCGEVGGDIYDIARLDNTRVRIFIADAIGHGVRGALVSMLIKSEYEKIKAVYSDPAMLLKNLNHAFLTRYENLYDFFPALVMDFHTDKKNIVFSSAGLKSQFMIKNNDSLIPLSTRGKMIGIASGSLFENSEQSYSDKDKVLIFTDGLYEQFNSAGESFEMHRVEKLVQDNAELSLGDIAAEILNGLKEFVGTEKRINENDDITIIGIEII